MKEKINLYRGIKYYIIVINIIVIIINWSNLLGFVASMIILTLLTLLPLSVYTIDKNNKFSEIVKNKYPLFYKKHSTSRYNIINKTFMMDYKISSDKEFIELLNNNERKAMYEYVSATKLQKLFALCSILSFIIMVTIVMFRSQ